MDRGLVEHSGPKSILPTCVGTVCLPSFFVSFLTTLEVGKRGCFPQL